MKVKDLESLFSHELKDLYSAESQITKALPKMIKKAKSAELKQALEEHLAETEQQIERLDQISAATSIKLQGHKCKGIEGIIKEGTDLISEIEDDEVLDAAIIASAQRVEHYEIAGYGTARAFAQELDLPEVVELLDQTLQEESDADKKLSELAESGGLNEQAIAANA